MADQPGQDSGHPLVPLSYRWGQLVEQLSEERGGLSELARYLLDVAPPGAALSSDPLTIERGLRRLRQQGNAPGNKYGQLLLRCCGVPRPVMVWARELGQYHSRSSDLPLWLRRDQLRLWDRPPISEAPKVAVWIQLALASLAHRANDHAQLARRMELARLLARRAEPAAQAELCLFDARLALDQGDRAACGSLLEEAAQRILTLAGEERACYLARLQDQRAYWASRGWREDPSKLALALSHYEAIDADPAAPPFVRFRREHGRAWCLWRMHQLLPARAAASLAIQHAGDGGLLRLRAMALGLAAHIAGPGTPEGLALRARADRILARLGES